MKTFLRRLGVVLLVLVLLVVGAYVAHGLHGAAEVAKAKKRAVADLAGALPGSKLDAAGDRDRVRAAYVPSWGRPKYAWQELVCELDTVDGGWIVQNYTQECRIRSVDLIPASTGVEGVRCSARALPALSAAAGSSYVWHSGAAASVGPASAFDEQHPYRLDCPDGILAPSRFGVARLLTGRRPVDLAASPAWIVVTVDTDVTTTTLGCDPWAIMFCSAPVERPVLGRVR